MKTCLPRTLFVLLLCLPILSACAKITTASVNVLGVNYTEQEFSYRLEDPNNPKNMAGGELIDSYSAGGIQCCFDLPRRWHAGIKVRILTTHWDPPPPSDPLQHLKEVRNSVVVDVPPYVDGKAGDLWVMKNADSSFGVISSSYQPDHPKWPGAVKGWPVPSVEYRRKLWDQQIQHEAAVAEVYERFLTDLRKDPVKTAKKEWDFERNFLAERYNKDRVPVMADWYRDAKAKSEFFDTFNGPTDPRFVEWLRNDYEKSLEEARINLQKIRGARP